MPKQVQRSSFTPRVSKGSAEKRRATPKTAHSIIPTVAVQRVRLREQRERLGLA
jgi:hypothetical protein